MSGSCGELPNVNRQAKGTLRSTLHTPQALKVRPACCTCSFTDRVFRCFQRVRCKATSDFLLEPLGRFRPMSPLRLGGEDCHSTDYRENFFSSGEHCRILFVEYTPSSNVRRAPNARTHALRAGLTEFPCGMKYHIRIVYYYVILSSLNTYCIQTVLFHCVHGQNA